MKKFTITALTTALCSLSITVSIVAPGVAQQPTVAPAPTPAAGTNPEAELIQQLKITKDQQDKLTKLDISVRQKKIAVLTPTQKEQLIAANKEGKFPNFTFTDDQQKKLKAINISALAQQETIFTPDQKQKLQEFKKKYAPKVK